MPEIRRRRKRLTARVLAGALLLSLAAPAGPAAAEDPVLVPWNDLLPGFTMGYDPSSEQLCVRGDLRCVDAAIREMERRLKPLARRCDHNAIFSLVYLRTTEAYREAVTTPGFFADPGFLNHYDAVFAKLYFDAENAWRGGRQAAVPPAWRVAFGAADRSEVSASGNLPLGISAHVNRDLPFVLAGIGLVAPDGTSRKEDHDRVNRFLNRVGDEELAELARRFDPSADDGDVEGTTVDETALFQLIQSWREGAWRNAERLVAARARGQAEYEATAASIERAAESEARSLVSATAYARPLTSPEARDAWCAVHWADD